MTAERLPPTGHTAHEDTFVRDRLPDPSSWPRLLYDFPELDYPPRLNVASELLDVHVTSGRSEAPCLLAGGDAWSYGRLRDEANRIARVLVEDLSMVPGNRVLLRGPNQPRMVAAWMAVAKAGGIIVATMPLLRAKELSVIADKAEVSLALCDERFRDELDEAALGSEFLERVVTFGWEEHESELERMSSKKPADFSNVETAVDDPVLIAFTSGTTGSPKGCVHLHRDLLASTDTFFRRTFPVDARDCFSGSPPLAFTFGLGMHVVYPMRIGARTALVEKPSPEALLETIERHRVSVLATAPTAYRAMLAHVQDADIASLRYGVSAGETLPLPTWSAWKETTGLSLVDGIGATEMFHIFITAVDENIRPGATGKPVYGYEAKTFDDELNEVPRGEIGRLGVRGPTGCRYLADERQNDYVRNGWNFTGDAYSIDEDGYFWFQARTDDMIISSGYNISGPEVEEALLAHDAVSDCACVASPDEERGHIVKAFVVLSARAEPTETLTTELQQFVKQRIAPYKYPRSVEFVDSLPRTETGKVQRFKLRQRELERSKPS